MRLSKLALPMAGYVILAILLGILGFTAASAIPVLGSWALGALIENPQFSLTPVFWILAGCAVLRGILRYGEQACNHYIAFRLLAHIRDLVYGALRRLAPAKLDGRAKGDLISLITSDVELLEVFYAHTISPICIGFFCSLLFAGIGFSIHWQIGLLLLISYLLVAAVPSLLVGKKAAETGTEYRKEAGKISALVLENTRGIGELLQYGQTDRRMASLTGQSDRLYSREAKLKGLQSGSTSLVNTMVVLFGFAMCLVSLHLLSSGSIRPAQALMAIAGQLSTFGPVIAVANLSTGLSQTIGAGERVLELLDEKPVTEEITEGLEARYGDMDLENVSFAYQKEEPVLEDFTLKIPQGKILGVSGPSGCGKSTMLRLLMRFWDPDNGTVSLSGDDLRRVTTKSLREQQGCVMQDTMLFADTIENNLKLVRPDATDEEMKEACRKASVLEFIESLPDGFKTRVAEMGSSLSAGERQRIGLARAFLHDSRILLLDEPTSNLDSLNEGAVLRAVDEEKASRSVVLISHRMGTLGFADENIRMISRKNEKNTQRKEVPKL